MILKKASPNPLSEFWLATQLTVVLWKGESMYVQGLCVCQTFSFIIKLFWKHFPRPKSSEDIYFTAPYESAIKCDLKYITDNSCCELWWYYNNLPSSTLYSYSLLCKSCWLSVQHSLGCIKHWLLKRVTFDYFQRKMTGNAENCLKENDKMESCDNIC